MRKDGAAVYMIYKWSRAAFTIALEDETHNLNIFFQQNYNILSVAISKDNLILLERL